MTFRADRRSTQPRRFLGRFQLLFCWIGVALIILMGVFPPWVYYLRGTTFSASYSLLWNPPSADFLGNELLGVRIDLPRLFVQWFLVGAFTVAALLSTRQKPDGTPGAAERRDKGSQPAHNAPLHSQTRNDGSVRFDPELVNDLFCVGGYHFEAGCRQFDGWSQKMVQELGEGIEPILPATFENIRAYFDLLQKEMSDSPVTDLRRADNHRD